MVKQRLSDSGLVVCHTNKLCQELGSEENSFFNVEESAIFEPFHSVSRDCYCFV